MTDTLIAYIASLENWPYITLGLLLLFSGSVLPLPEEIILLVAGYLVSVGALSFSFMLVVAYVAIFIGDAFIFSIARKGSERVEKVRRRIQESRLGRSRFVSPEHIGKTIFILRFVIGLRFFGPVIAATSKVSMRFFLFFDGLAILIFVPVLLFVGYHSYDQILPYLSEIETTRHIIFAAALAVVAFFIFRYAKRELEVKG